jgi:hypothetical protein
MQIQTIGFHILAACTALHALNQHDGILSAAICRSMLGITDTQLSQLERTRMQGALDEDESPLLLDLLRGVAQNLAVKGFTRVRVCFNSMPLALAARRLMTMNPFILRLDALGGSGLAHDDELVLLIRPNNALNWNKVR